MKKQEQNNTLSVKELYKIQKGKERKEQKQDTPYVLMPINLYNDNFQNFKRYNIPKAQFVIADIPYNIGLNAYASNPQWWNDREAKEANKEKAGKSFFKTDNNFNIAEFWHFCSKLVKEGKEPGCMLLFCAFEQFELNIQYAKKHGFKHNIPLVFNKKRSSQVLKSNMKIVGSCEYGFIFYKDKLPKFRNKGKMIYNLIDWDIGKKEKIPKIHPTQKPYGLLQYLISIFTDEGDVIIDPCCGSGVSLLAAASINRISYGFEIEKEYYKNAKKQILILNEPRLF